jgi:hypothetical protein
MQTLEAILKLLMQHQAMYLKRKVVTPMPRDLRHQICLWFYSASYNIFDTVEPAFHGRLFVDILLYAKSSTVR